MNHQLQLNKNGELLHLLTIEGLPASILTLILDTAESFTGVTEREIKKIPLLRGKSIFNLFLSLAHVLERHLKLLQNVYLQMCLT